MTTVTQDLSAFEILDAAQAIRTVTHDEFAGPIDVRDRRALATLAEWLGRDPESIRNITLDPTIVRTDDGAQDSVAAATLRNVLSLTCAFPLGERDAAILLDLVGVLPETTETEQGVWLACREAERNAEQAAAARVAEKRAEYTKGLRALADILESNPDLPLPYDGNGAPLSFIEGNPEETRRGAAVFAQVMPGTVDKSVSKDGAQFYLQARLYGLHLKWIAARAEVCTRVVVGTREVEIEEPDPEALAAVPKVKRVEVVEDVEWRCGSILAGAEAPEAVAE